MERYRSAAGTGAFSLQIPKYMFFLFFFFPLAFCLLSQVGPCRAAAAGDVCLGSGGAVPAEPHDAPAPLTPAHVF